MAKAKLAGWAYSTGEKGQNRVRAYEKCGITLLEFFERTDPTATPQRKRVSLGRVDRKQARLKADELSLKLRSLEAPQVSTLTLHALFYNWYLKEITPQKSAGKQRHDATCAEMFCRCFGEKRKPHTLNVRDWQKFIRERRSGTLRPLSLEEKPIRKVGDRQLRYDLKHLMAVLSFATVARDDRDVPLLTYNPLKGLAYPNGDCPRRPVLDEERYVKMRGVAGRVHALCESLLVVAHETGHRVGAVRQLRWPDVDLERALVNWRPETDKIGFAHRTPLSDEALSILTKLRRKSPKIGDHWVFPSPTNLDRPLPREVATDWWREAERLAELEHIPGMGFHSARRKFANDLKPTTNLRDLAYMGGWKSPVTLLTVYQQPDMQVQRDSLAARKRPTAVAQKQSN
jgi:integrase